MSTTLRKQPVLNAFSELYQAHCFLPGENEDLYREARKLREAVFLSEQGIELEENWDELDPPLLHWLVTDMSTGAALASARMAEVTQGCQTQPVSKLEWIAVLPERRHQGIGAALIQAMLEEARHQKHESAFLQARLDAVGFYQKLGFEREGFAFEEGNVTYTIMRCML